MASMSVRPPVVQDGQWWASHQCGGRSQPGKRQPRSRRLAARYWAVVTVRRAGAEGRIGPVASTAPWAKAAPAGRSRAEVARGGAAGEGDGREWGGTA